MKRNSLNIPIYNVKKYKQLMKTLRVYVRRISYKLEGSTI